MHTQTHEMQLLPDSKMCSNLCSWFLAKENLSVTSMLFVGNLFVLSVLLYLWDDTGKSSSTAACGGSHKWRRRRQSLICPTHDLVLHSWNLSGVLGSTPFSRFSLHKKNIQCNNWSWHIMSRICLALQNAWMLPVLFCNIWMFLIQRCF